MATGQAGAEVCRDHSPTLNCNHEVPYVVAVTGDIAHTLNTCNNGKGCSEDGTGRGVPTVAVCLPFDTTQITSAANRSSPKPGDPCHPLAAGAHAPAIAFDSRQDCVSSFEVFGALGSSSPQAQAVASGWMVRRLTPRECERLQGFGDDFTLIPWGTEQTKPVAGGVAIQDDDGRWHYFKPTPDGPRYKALGNSMAVPVMQWIGKSIEFSHLFF